MKPSTQSRFIERVILLFLAALFLLCSPARIFWASGWLPWFTPYLLWLILIILSWAIYRSLKHHESADHEL